VTVYYISNAGSSGNSGLSTLLPKATVGDVNGLTLSGDDEVRFNRGGTWRDATLTCKSGTSGHPVYYGAYGSGAAPVIRRTVVLTGGTLSSGSVYYFTGISSDPLQAFQDNARLVRAASVAAMASAAGTFFWDSATNRLYVRMTDSSNPSTKTVEASINTTTCATVANRNWVTIEDMALEAGWKSALTFRAFSTEIATNIVCRRVRVAWCSGRGFDAGVPSPTFGTRHSDLLLEFCSAHDNTGEDYWLGVVDRAQIRFCTSNNNGQDRAPLGANINQGEPCAYRIGINAIDVTIEYCEATNVYWGYTYHVESESFGGTGEAAPLRTTIRGCRVRAGDTGTTAQGRYVAYDQGSQSLWLYNEIWSRHDEWALFVDGSVLAASGTRIYHNVIISEGGGAAIRITNHTGANVRNNTIMLKQDNATFSGVSQSFIDVAANSQTSYVEDYNIFGQTGTQGGGTPVNWKWGASTYTTLAAYRTGTGQGAHSLGGTAGYDPGFVNFATGDYRITRASPARHAGVAISGIRQRVAGSAPDIGAYERGMVTRGPGVGVGTGLRRPADPAGNVIYADVVMADAPDAYWPLTDAAAASSGVDLSGNGHTISYRNRPSGGGATDIAASGGAFGLSTTGPHLAPNPTTGGLTFNGTTQLARATGPNFDGSSKGTINLWFYLTPGANNVQLVNTGDVDFTSKGVEIAIASNLTITAAMGNATDPVSSSLEHLVTTGRWHMLTVQFDVTQTGGAARYNRIWLDGAVVGYGVVSLPTSTVQDTAPTAGDVVFGRYHTLDQNYFSGALAHVEMFTNRVLSEDRIAARWNQAQANGLALVPPPQTRGAMRTWNILPSWGVRHHITPAPTAPLAWDSMSLAQRRTIILRHDVMHEFLVNVNSTGSPVSDATLRAIFDIKPNIILGGYVNMTSDEDPGYQGGGIMQGGLTTPQRAAMRLTNSSGQALQGVNGRAMMDPGKTGAGTASWRGWVAQSILDSLAGNFYVWNGSTYVRSTTLTPAITWTKRDGVTPALGFVFIDDAFAGFSRASGLNVSGKFRIDGGSSYVHDPYNPRASAAYTDATWAADVKSALEYVVSTVHATYPNVLLIFNGAWSYNDSATFAGPFGTASGQAPTSAFDNLATFGNAHPPDGTCQELYVHLDGDNRSVWNDVDTWAYDAAADIAQTRGRITLVMPGTNYLEGVTSPFRNAPSGTPVSFEPGSTTRAFTQPTHRYTLAGTLAAAGDRRTYFQYTGFATGLDGNSSLANDARTQELFDPGATPWPYWNVALGPPVSGSAVASALTGSGTGLYQRDFEWGMVLVNTHTTTNRTITLPATDGRGRAVATWYAIGLDGSVSGGTAAGGTYTVNARDGAILLTRTP
jgi:hypothetical protein